MCDLYAALVEYRSGISSCSYRAITAPKLGGGGSRRWMFCIEPQQERLNVGDFLAADSVGYSSSVPTVTARRWRLP